MEVMIPPWVRPESPETLRWIDDATVAFPGAFGRGMTQRGIFADPRWGLRRRYRGLRSDEKAAILNALNETRGQFNILRVTPHTPLRGSLSSTDAVSNGTFASGTTGWSTPADGRNTIAVSDRTMRLTLTTNSNNPYVYQQLTGLTQYATYVLRAFMRQGRYGLDGAVTRVQSASSIGGSDYGTEDASDYGMAAMAFVPLATSAYVHAILGSSASSGIIAGDYVGLQYVSCALGGAIDAGANLLVFSDEFDNVLWTKTNATASANAAVAFDGTTTADALVENTTNGFHRFSLDKGVSSSVLEYSFSVAVKAGTRSWCAIAMAESTGSTRVIQYVNLSTGAKGTLTTGANWSNARSFVVDMGSGWYLISLVAKKTSAATTVSTEIFAASADNSNSYAGVAAASAIFPWRATLTQSSSPGRPIHTDSVGTTGTSPTGAGFYIRGLPVSTSGLLLTGDYIEINGEVKQLTAPLNTDAAGRAYVQFRPSLAGSPLDGDAVVMVEPFGRFIYPQGTRELENLFGIYGDCEMNLEEIYS